jgi:hypothetical protein
MRQQVVLRTIFPCYYGAVQQTSSEGYGMAWLVKLIVPLQRAQSMFNRVLFCHRDETESSGIGTTWKMSRSENKSWPSFRGGGSCLVVGHDASLTLCPTEELPKDGILVNIDVCPKFRCCCCCCCCCSCWMSRAVPFLHGILMSQ